MQATGRRTLAALASVLAVGAATACGTATTAQSGPTRVDLLNPGTIGYQRLVADGFGWGVGEVPGVRQAVTAPNGADPVEQARLFSQLVAGGSSAGIAAWMQAPELCVQPIVAAAARHLPVVAVDSPPAPGTDVGLYVGNDNYALGRMLAGMVIDQLPAGAAGTVVVGSPRPGVPSLDARSAGIRDAFRDRLPHVQVLGPFDTSEELHGKQTAWQQLGTANPHALAFFGVGADGPALVSLRHHTNASWLAGSFDIDPVALRAVKQGELMLVSPEHFLEGAVAGRILAAHAAGLMGLPRGWIKVPGLAVTRSNVDSIIRRQATVASQVTALGSVLDSYFGPDGPPAVDLSLAR